LLRDAADLADEEVAQREALGGDRVPVPGPLRGDDAEAVGDAGADHPFVLAHDPEPVGPGPVTLDVPEEGGAMLRRAVADDRDLRHEFQDRLRLPDGVAEALHPGTGDLGAALARGLQLHSPVADEVIALMGRNRRQAGENEERQPVAQRLQDAGQIIVRHAECPVELRSNMTSGH
jgi:hypothetical protein